MLNQLMQKSLGDFNSSEVFMKCSVGSQENHVSTRTEKCNHSLEIEDISQHSIQCSVKDKEVVPKSKPCFTEYDRSLNQGLPTRHYENKSFSMTNGKLENLNGHFYNSSVTVIKYNNEGSAEKKFSLSGTNNTGTRPKTDIHGLKNQSKSRFNPESQKIDQIYYNVRICKEKWSFFLWNYLDWKKNRLLIITELENFKEKVHNDQLNFNQTNAVLKNVNGYSRVFQYVPGVSLIARVAKFLTGFGSTVTSGAQAANVHGYKTEFKKIVEKDLDATHILFSALSQSIEKHKKVEKIIRQFHSKISVENLDKIELLEIKDLWLDLKKFLQTDDVSDMDIQLLDKFFSKYFSVDDWEKDWESIVEPKNYNPDVVDACKSACMISKLLPSTCNLIGMYRSMSEAKELKDLVNDETMPQAKLESDIIAAINLLRLELEKRSRFVRKIHYLIL